MWTPKIGVFIKKSVFWPHKHIKNAKKSGIYAFILHNYPILVRSTGIEDVRQRKKALIFKAFLRWTPKWTPKFFWKELWDCLLIYNKIKVSFKRKNKTNKDYCVSLTFYLSHLYCAIKREMDTPCTSWRLKYLYNEWNKKSACGRKNKPNIEQIVFLWHFTYLVNLVP